MVNSECKEIRTEGNGWDLSSMCSVLTTSCTDKVKPHPLLFENQTETYFLLLKEPHTYFPPFFLISVQKSLKIETHSTDDHIPEKPQS